MMILAKEQKLIIEIVEVSNLNEIKYALETVLDAPDKRLESKIIAAIVEYLRIKIIDDSYKIKVFIAYDKFEVVGFVIAQINPEYLSYGKPCATFGWLRANSKEVCEQLLSDCEKFARENGFRKIRGPINYPKGLGGIGAQVGGFEEQMLYGVAFNPPKIPEYLDEIGYKRDAEYINVYVDTKTWNKGNLIDKSIKLRHLSLEEIIAREKEIMSIASGAFSFMLPDHSGVRKFKEAMNQYAQIPKEHFKKPENFNISDWTDVLEFVEDWEESDIVNTMTWAHFALDRETNDIVGAIFCLPDLYELWLDKPITRANVDTVFTKPGYQGKGIFSSLHNIGQISGNLTGVNYFEGTSIWNKNEKAVKSIFPHTSPFRKFYVFQKRIRG